MDMNLNKIKSAGGLLLVALILLLAFGTISFAQGQRYKSPDAWSFGVHGDTQWTLSLTDPNNWEGVAVSVINQINQKMISNNVKFVVQVGDLTDYAGDGGFVSRAAAAQPLFDKGIGFFPLRGNHETYGYLLGRDPLFNLNVPDFKARFPQTQGQGDNLFGAANFSWPSSTNDILKGLSYSFDYGFTGNNAKFVVVDTEQTAAVSTAAPNDTDNVTAAQLTCNTAITTGYTVGGITYGGAPAGTKCGQGYWYILHDWVEGGYKTGFIVWQATAPITGITTNYNSAGVATGTSTITLTPGTWFRIDSSKRPSTNFYAWDIPNPDGMYNGQPFDINYPISDPENRVLTQLSTAGTEYFPGKQQAWISAQLDKTTRGTEHAFVFSHRAIIAENHTDSFFGSDSAASPADQNTFFASMRDNEVKYLISGHDHLFNRAILVSPDGNSKLQQIVSIGASTKFYSPAGTSSFPAGVKARETQLAQEVYTMGYYIYTVDGPRVTVDYYSTIFPDGITGFSDNYPFGDAFAGIFPLGITPTLDFAKKETFGYSLNGMQFTVASGAAYAGISDTSAKLANSLNTTATLLAGINSNTAVDGNGRLFSKDINTGWTAKNNPMLASDILSLWGLENFGTNVADTYVLSMSYVDPRINGYHRGNGGFRLAGIDANGQWVKASTLNNDKGTKKFVKGPYDPSYGLGAYGVDTATQTVWAVLDYAADFSAVKFELDVATSSFVYNRAKKTYNGKITITNNSEDTIEQAYVYLTNLPSGVTLLNPSGVDDGLPFVSVPQQLQPGASISIPLSFSNPSNTKINFTPVTYTD